MEMVVCVTLVNFILLYFQVDAIVNLTSRNLDLSQGFISKDIVKKGGQKIQDELTKVVLFFFPILYTQNPF